MGKVAVECLQCGGTFWVDPYRVGEAKFCSRTCRGRWRSRNWMGADNPFYGRHHTEKTKKIISQKNKGNHHTQETKRRISRTMKQRFRIHRHPFEGRHLSDETKRKISEALKKWRRSHPFTRENNPRWKGGYEPYYGSNWYKQKRKARERDSYTCQVCGGRTNGRALDVHHIISFREFGRENYKEANQLSNLITLCIPCHGKADAGKIPIDTLRGIHIPWSERKMLISVLS